MSNDNITNTITFLKCLNSLEIYWNIKPGVLCHHQFVCCIFFNKVSWIGLMKTFDTLDFDIWDGREQLEELSEAIKY